jgi:nucleoside-diphosphate-sugar epimerase
VEQTIAVTGASGMLGQHLCRLLKARGYDVLALVRDPSAAVKLPPTTRIGRCDLPDALDEALLAGASALVHCAYATRETDLERARRVNEDGTRRLLEAARSAGIPRFVFVSSIAAASDAPSYYARSKHALEALLDPERDLVLAPGLILAREGQGLFQQMRDTMQRLHVVPLFGGGSQPLQTVHVDDVCEALARALERGLTGRLQVAEPDPPTLGGFLRLLARRLGIRCLFVPLPFGPVLATLRGAEAVGIPLPLRSESLLGLRGLRAVDVTEDLRRLGFAVRSAEQSLDAVV